MIRRQRPLLFRVLLAILLVAALFHAPEASAHEIRPAYLQIDETTRDHYALTWRTPLLSGMRLPVVLKLPAGVRNEGAASEVELPGSLVERLRIEAPGGLAGKRIEFVGLQATLTEVLVRIRMRDGAHWTTLVHPSRPWVEITAASGLMAVAGAFLMHGIEHILFGYDHLLFVFALILIVPDRRVLLTTITAFTIAHSITLALATLGVVHVPRPPVEATIALSIILLASEIVRLQRGDSSLTARWPWVVAFSFGLLHGFGFASALSDIGLPASDIPLALFLFNVGVEIGQLTFIALVLSAFALGRRIRFPTSIEGYALRAAPYAIGVLAACWFFERLAAFAG